MKDLHNVYLIIKYRFLYFPNQKLDFINFMYVHYMSHYQDLWIINYKIE